MFLIQRPLVYDSLSPATLRSLLRILFNESPCVAMTACGVLSGRTALSSVVNVVVMETMTLLWTVRRHGENEFVMETKCTNVICVKSDDHTDRWHTSQK